MKRALILLPFTVRLRHCLAVLSVALAFVGALPLAGCGLAAYGLGVGAMVADMKTRQREDYARYRAEAEASRTKPLTFRQWLRGVDD